MKVEITQHGDTIVAHLAGQIDTIDDEGLADALCDVAARKPAAVVLDFSNVGYLASQGIGLLINFHRAIRTAGGSVSICRVSPAVRTILESVRLNALIPIHENEVSAVAAMV